MGCAHHVLRCARCAHLGTCTTLRPQKRLNLCPRDDFRSYHLYLLSLGSSRDQPRSLHSHVTGPLHSSLGSIPYSLPRRWLKKAEYLTLTFTQTFSTLSKLLPFRYTPGSDFCPIQTDKCQSRALFQRDKIIAFPSLEKRYTIHSLPAPCVCVRGCVHECTCVRTRILSHTPPCRLLRVSAALAWLLLGHLRSQPKSCFQVTPDKWTDISLSFTNSEIRNPLRQRTGRAVWDNTQGLF